MPTILPFGLSRRTLGLWICACFFSPLSSGQDSPPSPQEERALRGLTQEWIAACNAKDAVRAFTLWSQSSPSLEEQKKLLQEQFATEDVSFTNAEVSHVSVEGEKASLRLTFDHAAVHRKSKDRREERLARKVEFVKEGQDWKFWRYFPAANELAKALLEANTETARNALLAAQKDLVTAELVRELNLEGTRLMYQKADYQRATTVVQLAQTVAEGIGDNIGIARALASTGIIHRLRGDFDQAIPSLEKSLAISEAGGSTLLKAIALNNIGIVHSFRGELGTSLEFLKRSLSLYEQLDDPVGTAGLLTNIGTVHRRRGEFREALEYYRRGIALAEAVAYKPVISAALNNIGHIHNLQGDYVSALASFQKSLAISEASADKAGLMLTLGNIGYMHELQGNYEQAIEYRRKSLAIAEGIGDQDAVVSALSSIGSAEIERGKYDQALDYLLRSLTLRETTGNKADMHHTLHDIGVVHSNQGNYAEALKYFEKSLRISKEVGETAGVARSLHSISSVYEKQGRYTEALEFSNRAVALALERGLPEILWQAQLTCGRIYQSLKEYAKARQSLEQAINSIETIRGQVAGAEQEQQRFLEARVAPYHALVELLVAQSNTADALTYAERAKARVLVDVLYGGRNNVTKSMTEEEQERERQLNGLLVSLNSQIYRENTLAKPDETRLVRLRAELQRARSDFEAFQTSLYAVHSSLETHRGSPPVFQAQEVSTLLPDTRTAVLEFVVAENRTWLFVLSREPGSGDASKMEVYKLEVNEKDLAAKIENFRRLLASADNRFAATARDLYNILLRPAAGQLSGKTRLVVVPDGPLWELPMQALMSPGGRYVIDDQTVSFAPSLTALREMIKVSRSKARPHGAPTLLALGNPTLSKGTVARVTGVFMDEKLDPLPEAEKQVRTLEKMYGPSQSKAYVRGDAREERFKSESGRYQILHLATHGILNDRSPMYSHLLLAQPGEGSKEDGLLEAWELMKMDLNAELVVLSACETARGRIGKGEGMIGLTWALFVAGVPKAVVSQWKVRSDSTAELMVGFHRQLKAQAINSHSIAGVADAMRHAALELKTNARYRHPFHWAGFIVVGDGY